MKDFAKSIVCNTKVGNETLHEYATSKPRVINDDKTGAEEFFKQLSDDVKEREKKDDADIEKVGNREIYVNQSEQTKAVVYEDGTIMLWDKNGNNYKTIKSGSLEEARKKLNSDYKKVGNKTYKVKESSGHDGGYDYGYIVVDESNRSVGRTFSTRSEAEEYIRDLYKKEKAGNKVGNARYTTREDVISHLDTDLYDICKKVPAGSPSYAYVSELQKKGWDISTISKYSKEIGKIIDRYKVGNSKTGNATYTEADRKRLYELAKKRNKTAQEWAEFDELNRREEQASRELIKKIGKSKTGNSAQDDKFAYVMREFDEGKLKTPDGKVVTDPAQAKAIAYSESKKTENGLARARNAMAGNGKTVHEEGPYKVVKEGGYYIIYKGTKKIEEVPTLDEALDDIEVWLYGND